MNAKWRWVLAAVVIALPVPVLAQHDPPAPGTAAEPHDISKVDTAPLGGAIAVPIPEKQRRRLKRYEIPELVGAQQAIGSQLIDGRLPLPLVDYHVRNAVIDQRISFFEGGLVVVRLSGAGGTIQKRVIIPPDALEKYLEVTSARSLRKIGEMEVTPPAELRTARLRIYDGDSFVERLFDPTGTKPKRLQDQVGPLEDLLRAITEDREVTSSVAGYEPKVGDELVGDDRRVYRVERVIADSGIVQLRCVSQPTILYIAKKDLHNYFVGKPAQ
ncbi:MAG TPA: hypothetical protein VMS98_04250 [Thermoanaerobaculia bacterium]|nr:hypothetical protein [Thermoanaerobaculia bacterium]